jgi:hypothetical protein
MRTSQLKASITRLIAGCFLFLTLIQCFDRRFFTFSRTSTGQPYLARQHLGELRVEPAHIHPAVA